MSRIIDKPVFVGAMAIGILSLIGGVVMFIFVVPKGMQQTTGGIPREINFLFTNVFSQQVIAYNESNRYAAALTQIGVDSQTCERYSCRLTVPPSGKEFQFRLSQGGHTWAIDQKSFVPREVL